MNRVGDSPGQSSKIKFQKYHEVATKKSFKGLLESREIDFNAVCFCFQHKLRIIFTIKATVDQRCAVSDKLVTVMLYILYIIIILLIIIRGYYEMPGKACERYIFHVMALRL